MKHLKIYAAFDKDVEEDIVRFGDFLCNLNTQCKDIEFSIFKDEKELCEYLEHPKEKIDGELDACEYFLLILGSKNGDYALDKLSQAIENYSKTQGNPDIHIFVNASKEGSDSTRKYFSSEKYEHFVEQYNHIDTLKAKFLTWLSAKEKAFSYEVDTDIYGSPVIKVGGRPVSGLVDFDALLNNEDYQDEKKKLIRNRSKREKYIEELRNSECEDRNDLWDDISALTKEIEEQQDKVSKMEKDTLALYQNYAKMTLENGYNSRLKRALECIEKGDLDRARKVLDPESSLNNLKAIENENELLTARIETNKKIAEQEINILFAEIDRLKLNTENKNRFEEIEKCYANIEYYQEKLGLEMTVLFNYAVFLEKQNKHNTAIEKYEKELSRCRRLAETIPDLYLSYIVMVLNCLSVLYKEVNRYKEAETICSEALDITQKLAENNSNIYLLYMASVKVILAVLQTSTHRYKEAESNFNEALDIYKNIKNNNPDILSKMAYLLINFADLQIKIKCNKEAEKNYNEALEIFRKLIVSNPDVYLPDLALLFNSLASLQNSIKRYVEAESNFSKALNIRQKLAENNPDAYLPDVASSLNDLAVFQTNTFRYIEAESNFNEAITIYKKITESNPNVYLPVLQNIFRNLADLHSKLNRYEEAMRNSKEVLNIREKIDEIIPEANEHDRHLDAFQLLAYSAALKRESNLDDSNKAYKFYKDGEDYYRRNQYFHAIEYYSKAIKLDPIQAGFTYYKKRGDVYKKLGLNNFFIEDYTELIRFDPNNSSYYNIRGISYFEQYNYKMAINDFSEAIKLDSKSDVLFCNRGNSYYQIEQYDLAMEDYLEALSINSDNKTACEYIEKIKKRKELDPDKKGIVETLSQVEIDQLLIAINAGNIDPENISLDNDKIFENIKENFTQDEIKYLFDIADVSDESNIDKTFIQISIVIAKNYFPSIILNEFEFGLGTILQFNKIINYPVDIYVENIIIAQGEIVIIDDNFGVRIITMKTIDKNIEQITTKIDQTFIPVSIVLGNKKESLRKIINWGKGTFIEIDKTIEKDMDVYAEDKKIAMGEVVDIDNYYGIKITELDERRK